MHGEAKATLELLRSGCESTSYVLVYCDGDGTLSSTENRSALPWWGIHTFAEQPGWTWALENRTITIRRDPNEWKVWDRPQQEESSAAYIHKRPAESVDEPEEVYSPHFTLTRLIQDRSHTELNILPALADRFMVVSPSATLHLLPGESATLFVSTPLWFTAKTTTNQTLVLDLPFWRPSDSWFGPSTREGEMCYAKYTDARLDLSLLEQRQHRAVTPVHVINKAKDVLTFERINIPVPLLTLYSGENAQLWTNQLTLTRNDDRDIEVDIAQSAPFDHLNPTPVNTARLPSERRTLMRNLSSLFA
ncbi:hypothetical protein MED297_11920 [Reinekea sp. MED297]|uniref:Uncharacterized protein n=1 Tax=Reinekea blandensis MED297 TaxID=314283 RepID=A4BBA9_9GAMM|nr:hypothetical protein MED297_11920 [Reinekea sp. MED297] [Reinekea blandensis MED297]